MKLKINQTLAIKRERGETRFPKFQPFGFIKVFGIIAAAALLGLTLWVRPATGQPPQEGRPQKPETGSAGASKSAESESSPANVIFASSEDYQIGPSDVIEINVADAPELSGKFPVSASGIIPMPFVGDLSVKGKAPAEVAKIIADKLRGEYLRDPRVTVAVLQYNSRSFFIQGAVRQPGVYQIRGKASLLKLISFAGGLADNHGSNAYIIREVKPGVQEQASSGTAGPDEEMPEKYKVLEANITGLIRGNLDNNVIIEPGDMVNIPPSDVFFVGGEVIAPGQFPLKDGTTLRQAIALAQGVTFEASKGNTRIFRENPKTGEQEEITVDVGAVMDGKKDDIPILANDIIVVPRSGFRSVGGALLKSLGLSTASRGVRY